MQNLLLELYSEEIPARMQNAACERLGTALSAQLSDAGIPASSVRAYVTPRRLCLVAEAIPAESSAKTLERRGPRVGAPDRAVSGFCRSVGLSREQLEVRTETRGEFYFAVREVPGEPTRELIGAVVQSAVKQLIWPKSMTWDQSGFRWVRPLRSVLCILYDGSSNEIIDLEIGGIKSGDKSRGHPVMHPGEFRAASFASYKSELAFRFVVLDQNERKQIIASEARRIASKHELLLVEDDELLSEIAGLVEWPVPMLGEIEDRFLTLPSEVLVASMKQHQKYLSLRKPENDSVTHFVAVANREARDGGRKILAGNQLVLSARLADARFVWNNDLRRIQDSGLESMADSLQSVDFHPLLGTQYERVTRIRSLALAIAPAVGADPGSSDLAASLAKADLVSETVVEFPELQGIAGRYFSSIQGFGKEVSDACELHYEPVGASGQVPDNRVAVAVGLADRIDFLTGFFGIGERPTGSKDPFGLRRMALGIIRLVLDSDVRISLGPLLEQSALLYGSPKVGNKTKFRGETASALEFIRDRFRIFLRDRGARLDVVDACIDAGENDDFVYMTQRIAALETFLVLPEAADLVQGFRRVGNILDAEKKKGRLTDAVPEPDLAVEPAEIELFTIQEATARSIDEALDKKDLEAAIMAMASLRQPVDSFFDSVLVNTKDPEIRANRLALLKSIRDSCIRIADLSRLELGSTPVS